MKNLQKSIFIRRKLKEIKELKIKGYPEYSQKSVKARIADSSINNHQIIQSHFLIYPVNGLFLFRFNVFYASKSQCIFES